MSTEQAFDSGGVRGVLHQPDSPTGEAIALTHGAGANCHAPLLARFARVFAGAGVIVLRYDLPFRQLRPKGPPFPAQAARDREGVAHAIDVLRRLAGGPVFAGGHSYGGRQTAMAASERPGLAAALLLLSYPLHPPGKPEKPRTDYFSALRTPVLFVHGSVDPFGSLEELNSAVKVIPARTELFPIERAGHDLARAAGVGQELLVRLRTLSLA
ncbi:MAG TPA: alpha/beta family hydrolase [Bryobacteraceae bacterium]|nr:alpha/beta family hydrolase [Bryobacteraceae bacterium]